MAEFMGVLAAMMFLAMLAGGMAIAIKYREDISDWLNGTEKKPGDAKLAELQEAASKANIALRKYRKYLRLKHLARTTQEELDELEAKSGKDRSLKAETGD